MNHRQLFLGHFVDMWPDIPPYKYETKKETLSTKKNILGINANIRNFDQFRPFYRCFSGMQ